MFYLGIIFIAVLIVAAWNAVLFSTFLEALFYTLFGTVAVIAVDAVTALLVRHLPERWFAPDSPRFHVGEKERKFYRKLKIKAWKDKVPELGCFTGFHKNKFESSGDSEYLARFLLESNYGVVIHIVNALAGFLIVFIPQVDMQIGVPVAIVNCVLSLMPVAILRYHTAPLRRLYIKSLQKREAEMLI